MAIGTQYRDLRVYRVRSLLYHQFAVGCCYAQKVCKRLKAKLELTPKILFTIGADWSFLDKARNHFDTRQAQSLAPSPQETCVSWRTGKVQLIAPGVPVLLCDCVMACSGHLVFLPFPVGGNALSRLTLPFTWHEFAEEKKEKRKGRHDTPR